MHSYFTLLNFQENAIYCRLDDFSSTQSEKIILQNIIFLGFVVLFLMLFLLILITSLYVLLCL